MSLRDNSPCVAKSDYSLRGGKAERRQWREERGGSPVSKGAPGRPHGPTQRDLCELHCGPRTPRGFFDRLILVSCLFSPFQFLGFSASYTTRARKANPFTERKNFFAGDGKAGRQKYLRNPLGICYNLYVKNSPLAGALLGSTAAGSNHFIKTGKGESPCRPKPARKPYWLRTPI